MKDYPIYKCIYIELYIWWSIFKWGCNLKKEFAYVIISHLIYILWSLEHLLTCNVNRVISHDCKCLLIKFRLCIKTLKANENVQINVQYDLVCPIFTFKNFFFYEILSWPISSVENVGYKYSKNTSRFRCEIIKMNCFSWSILPSSFLAHDIKKTIYSPPTYEK